MEEKIVFEGDNCYLETPIYISFDDKYPCVKRKLVMTKEVFIECYNKWIKENNDER